MQQRATERAKLYSFVDFSVTELGHIVNNITKVLGGSIIGVSNSTLTSWLTFQLSNGVKLVAWNLSFLVWLVALVGEVSYKSVCFFFSPRVRRYWASRTAVAIYSISLTMLLAQTRPFEADQLDLLPKLQIANAYVARDQLQAHLDDLDLNVKNVEPEVRAFISKEIPELPASLSSTIKELEPEEIRRLMNDKDNLRVRKMRNFKLANKNLAEVDEKIQVVRAQLAQLKSEINDRIDKLEYIRELVMAAPLTQPIKNVGRVTSGFGKRRSPFNGKTIVHKGLDIAAKKGTRVYVPSAGVVIKIGRNLKSGKYIVVSHGSGIETMYAHLDQIKVRKGQSLNIGRVIGTVGTSGITTGPHLHYEVRLQGRQVNPQEFVDFVEDETADLSVR